MSDVAELLVLLHGARGRISTVRATVRIWRHLRRQDEAFARAGWTGYAPVERAGETAEELVRVWLAPPDRVREERQGTLGSSLGVCRGAEWWRYHELSGALCNQGAPDERSGIGDELRWLLDAAR